MTELQSWSTNSSLHSPEKLQEFGEATVLALERVSLEMENMGGEADEVVATEEVFVLPEDDAMRASQSSEAVMLFKLDRGIKKQTQSHVKEKMQNES